MTWYPVMRYFIDFTAKAELLIFVMLKNAGNAIENLINSYLNISR